MTSFMAFFTVWLFAAKHYAYIFTTTCFSVWPCSRERAASSVGSAGAGAAGREFWRTKSSVYSELYTQDVEINMEEQESQQAQAAEAKLPKERPVWLTQSTVQGAYNENDSLKAGQYHFTTVVSSYFVDLYLIF